MTPVQRLILDDLRAGWKLVQKTETIWYLTSTPLKPTRGRHRLIYTRSLECTIRDEILDASGELKK